jgi:hypothetical protein
MAAELEKGKARSGSHEAANSLGIFLREKTVRPSWEVIEKLWHF